MDLVPEISFEGYTIIINCCTITSGKVIKMRKIENRKHLRVIVIISLIVVLAISFSVIWLNIKKNDVSNSRQDAFKLRYSDGVYCVSFLNDLLK